MSAIPQHDGGGQLDFSFEAPRPTARQIWRIGDLVGSVRSRVEREYADVWVEGEISNLRAAPSGHLYFTLKDAEAQLPAVLFRKQASLLRFKPQDGLQVLLRGKVSVYEQRGQMQLVAEYLEPLGAGSLQVAFEQLKAKLLARGLFDAERKKPLPAFPRCIGVVTSPAGAVIRDILSVVQRRHAALDVLLYPAVVQGEAAAAEVAAGIAYFNRARNVDLIVIARGGGSLEDLASFNTEFLAEAIAASELPVVSAVGHETDFTIADFASDLRAPTPSAAAELITAAQHRIEEIVLELATRLQRACRYRLMQAANALGRISFEGMLARTADQLHRKQQRLDDLCSRTEAAWRRKHRSASEELHAANAKLVRQDAGHRVRSAQEKLVALMERMARAETNHIGRCSARQESSARHLQSLSPLAVLQRGYAVVFDEWGALVRDVRTMDEGSSMTTRLAGGSIESRVTRVSPEEKREA